MKPASFTEKDRASITGRLRRIEGQIRGLQRMVEEDRGCAEIVLQLAAARVALDRTGNVIVASSLRGCLADAKLGQSKMEQVNIALGALASLRS